MKTKIISALTLATGFFATVALAENQTATPATAPVVTVPSLAAPNQVIYAPQLPVIAELNKVAAAQGTTVALIAQSPRELSVTFQSPDGRTNIVSYRLLADAGARPVQIAAPAITYVTPQPVYEYEPFYAPYWNRYPPVSFRFGFGYRGGRHW